MINTMINYLLGVKFEDEEFYRITEEEEHADQSQSQTSEITVYEVFVEENPISLTIIDTPGYGDTRGYEKDAEISDNLIKLFSDEDGIHYIDAVCFVMKASQNRLSGRELYIFHSVLSLFGRDIEENVVFLLTQSDGLPPADALNAINTAEIPCRRDEDNQPVHFLFNNQQKQKREKWYKQVLMSSWTMVDGSMSEFFTFLEEKNRKSVKITLDVMKQRKQLEACVFNLRQRITEKELKTDELNQIQEAIRQNRDEIKKSGNFKFTVIKSFKEKVPTENEWWWNSYVTCCDVCEENCHEWGCVAISKSWCEVMKNEKCTVCSGKCHYSEHRRENKKYVTKTKKVIMTFNELKQEYECNPEKSKIKFDKSKFEDAKKEHESDMKEFEFKTVEENLIRDLEKIKTEKSNLLHDGYVTIMSLSQIALKADSAFSLQHLDFLIPRLKEEGKDKWTKTLEDLRKTGEHEKNKGAIQTVKDCFTRLTHKM
ncbi:hypothetical protein QQF64_023899 [Cirrhinus molitorella]|uniref:AIG1-type G domain-containing protein n=1 Tax=Cirrhinus molitorella TaxID=172907 RepID=A0ABR3NJQ5_9TELE